MLKEQAVVSVATIKKARKNQIIENKNSKGKVFVSLVLANTMNVDCKVVDLYTLYDEVLQASELIKSGKIIEDNIFIYKNMLYYILDTNNQTASRIVATNNPDYWTNSHVAKIDMSFIHVWIKSFNEEKTINAVMVKYNKIVTGERTEVKVRHPRTKKIILLYQSKFQEVVELQSNGSIVILPVRAKLYTEEQVCNILCEFYDGHKIKFIHDPLDRLGIQVSKWLKTHFSKQNS